MHEYEFRLVIQSNQNLDYVLKEFGGTIFQQKVFYVKPHFRFRNRTLEIKTVCKTEMVYHDHLWFKWVHSKEIPYQKWTASQHKMFLNAVGNFQCPFRIETRHILKLDPHAQVYTFQAPDGMFRLVFEWEYGTFETELKTLPTQKLLKCLQQYREIYKYFHQFSYPQYTIDENILRKPVTCIPDLMQSDDCLVAHKWDGIFGMVCSYPDRIVEKWEGGLQKIHKGITIDDGVVFSAEKLTDVVILLDVYEVQGHPVASWCRQNVFLQYLPKLQLPKGYRVQEYYYSAFELPQTDFETDGFIIHDITKDKVFKVKENHSVDVIYNDGYFYFPGNRFKSLEETNLTKGHVYEVSISDGRVIRKRNDRMTGNTLQQVKNILSNGRQWKGPPIEKVIPPTKCHKKKRKAKH